MQGARCTQGAYAREFSVDPLLGGAGGENGIAASGWAGEVCVAERTIEAGPAHLAEEVTRLRRELACAERRIAELEDLADRDMLTPLLNRRAFAREMSRLLSLGKRCNINASLIYFDVDDLKSINDRLGHDAGDAALLHVACLIQSCVRASDLVGRLGGDEFAVALLRADAATAARKAQAMVTTLACDPLWWQKRPLRLGMAFGVCPLTPDMDVPTALARADRAMYRRKRSLKAGMIESLMLEPLMLGPFRR